MKHKDDVGANELVLILTKYTVNILLFLCLFVHVFFVIFFFAVGVPELAEINIVSSSCYVLLLLFGKKMKMLDIIVLVFIEILIYSVLATFAVGVDSGFFMYSIAMIPVMFFLMDTMHCGRTYPFLCGIIGTFVMLLLIAVMTRIESMYHLIRINYILLIVNVVIVAAINIIFSYMFVNNSAELNKYLKEKNDMLDYLSKYDPLTNLYNRRAMDKVLKENTSKSYAICICDIDDFKMVNDIYGHDAGDMILKSVAKMHKESVCNGTVCRWGGEELLILLNDVDLKTAYDTVEAIRKKVSEKEYCYEDTKFNVTMTYGLVLSDGSDNFNQVIKRADNNLYIGKRNGKNCVVTGN